MKRLPILAFLLFAFACAEQPQPPKAVEPPTPVTKADEPVSPPEEKKVLKAPPKKARDVAAPAPKDDEKKGEPAANCDRLPKEWNLKVKSVGMTPGRAWITLEFTKGVDEKELKRLKFAFQNSGYAEPRPPAKDKSSRETEEIPIARIYFFDSDNVSIQSVDARGGIIISELIGEVTGKTPDAFRISAPALGDVAKRLKKIEVRTVKVPKP